MGRLVKVLLLGCLFALGVALGWLFPALFRSPILPRQDAVVSGVPAGSSTVAFVPALGGYLEVRPDQPFDTLFILYPGGLVRPQAYVWLGVALAPLGVRTVIPVFPFDLAVTAPERAAKLMSLAGGQPVVLGGHSLGGAMAARFALKRPDDLSGLVLMGAYSAAGDDLHELVLSTVVLAAEHDGLATLAEMREGLPRLPESTRMTIIRGAVHSFFGRYGPQRGDGLPSVTRAEAEGEIVRALRRFFAPF